MSAEPLEPLEPLEPEPDPRAARRGFIARWVEQRAERAIRGAVSSSVESLEESAAKVVGSLYEEKAADLEERAVRALRRAIEAESDRIRATIEHAVLIKKREVRLSLCVLVGASLVYLILYWLTHEVPG